VLTGQVPWITGWDMIDCVYVAALDGDLIHFLLVDAVRSPSLTPTQQRLVAVEASRTVNVVFEDHFVPADRLLSTIPYDEWLAGDTSGSTLNGFLSLGLARRCCLLLGPSGLDAELDAARTALLSPDEDAVPQARARASELALRAAVALTVRTGARAVLRDQHAQRLMREATFLLVFGSRRTIQAALLERLVPAL
jgi:alkylation response protein AidB-like acyl-CoA dehydrogenase